MSRIGQRNEGGGTATSRLVDSMDQMIRWPFQMTGATWDLMVQGMQSVSGSGQGRHEPSGSSWSANSGSHVSSSSNLASSSNASSRPSSDQSSSGSSWTSMVTGQNDQDLGGDDLKYVIWSIVFVKPGLECVLEPQHEEIVNYPADGASFAAVKIAKLLEKTRHGHVKKPESWRDAGYPADANAKVARAETTTVIASPTDTTVSTSSQSRRSASMSSSSGHDEGWRIPAEDQRYIKFLYRVDRRLPRQEAEVIERVTIERGTKIV